MTSKAGWHEEYQWVNWSLPATERNSLLIDVYREGGLVVRDVHKLHGVFVNAVEVEKSKTDLANRAAILHAAQILEGQKAHLHAVSQGSEQAKAEQALSIGLDVWSHQ
ncbi:MAG: hypothetical protein FRX49_03793 [Trebouxia sp. A1-2]|nr:MAG: hypothetical protein FRX49_03793 [Trebouxia sp. A1-2]